jgi:hypothetical protein
LQLLWDQKFQILSSGAKVLQAGGIHKVFREYFAVEKDEKLLEAFQCYLSTTVGPIAGNRSTVGL